MHKKIFLTFVILSACGPSSETSNDASSEITCDPENCEASGCTKVYFSLIDQDETCYRPESYCARSTVEYIDGGIERTSIMTFKHDGQCWQTLDTTAPKEFQRIDANDPICGKFSTDSPLYSRRVEQRCADVEFGY